jgi:hypothetical protein
MTEIRKRKPVRCAFEGCYRTSDQPFSDGWSYLSGWGPGVPDGDYCPGHVAAIEAIKPDIRAENERATTPKGRRK